MMAAGIGTELNDLDTPKVQVVNDQGLEDEIDQYRRSGKDRQSGLEMDLSGQNTGRSG